jgi:LysM repeat protein
MNPGPPLFDDEPEPQRVRATSVPPEGSGANGAVRWTLTAVMVLLLAASAGLVLAWLVATMHAVPGPVGAIATPTLAPGETAAPSGPTPSGTEQPRHTPTPAPGQTQEPVPFTYVVQRGDSVTWIADMFQVQFEDLVALNDLKPPRYRIFIGQELLIPGYGQQPPPTPTPKPRRTHHP